MMKRIVLGIEGMSCAACSSAIEKYLSKQDGISYVSVNLVMANATVEYDPDKLTQKQIENFIKDVGYKSTGLYKMTDETKKVKNQKTWLIVLGALLVVLLYISMGTMFGLPIFDFMDMDKNSFVFATVLLCLTLPYLIYGVDIFKNGIKTLFHKAPNMDTLVTLGVFASLGYSIYAYVMIALGNVHFVHSLYFESCSVIVYFIKLGRYVDRASKNKTKQAISELVQITPNYAFVKIDGKEKKVSIDEIKKGDIVVCRAGEKIAVDGVVVGGFARIDESFITGESKPVSKQKDGKVVAGSLNLEGVIEYRAERIGKDSTVSEIVRLVVEATNTKMPIAKIADKVSGIFVPVVMLIAVLTFIVYVSIGQSIDIALSTFVTVLVVACPCSLGLATPLAIVVSEGMSAKNGILVKKSETLEIANKTNVVVFDKTGTLTYGKLKISKIINNSEFTEAQLLQFACSVESKSSHPISSAFTEKAKEKNIKFLDVEEFKNLDGLGLVGKIGNKKVVLGNSKILKHFKIKNTLENEEKELSSEGNSIVFMAIDGKIVSLFGVNDILKENAKDTVAMLKSRGIEVYMLTGDNEITAMTFAKQLGLENVVANVLPSEKAKFIKKLKKENNVVMMVGDGINDSPALASADIGVSVSNGTDIAMNSADVILVNDNISKILNLFLISKKTVKNIKQNLFWAFFYNCLMIPIAVGAFRPLGVSINPMIAGIAMVLSSLTVVFNALRLQLTKLKGDKTNV